MSKIITVSLLILLVCGLVSSAYAEKMAEVETSLPLIKQERVKPEKPGKIKIERYGAAVGEAVKIVDSQGKPVKITDEAGKPLDIIVGSKGNLVVQKTAAVQKPGLIKPQIIRPEKAAITGLGKPQKLQKPEIVKPQSVTNFR